LEPVDSESTGYGTVSIVKINCIADYADEAVKQRVLPRGTASSVEVNAGERGEKADAGREADRNYKARCVD